MPSGLFSLLLPITFYIFLTLTASRSPSETPHRANHSTGERERIVPSQSNSSVSNDDLLQEVALQRNAQNPSTNHSPIFEPTTEFQPIHEGQAIPGGLHIRINLASGANEAKFNDPSPESNHDHSDNEGNNQIILLDNATPDTDNNLSHPTALLPNPFQPKAVPHGGYGPLPPPLPPTHPDHALFTTALKDLIAPSSSPSSSTSSDNSDPSLLPDTLSTLSDLTHDLYFGSTLAHSASAVHTLTALLHSHSQSNSDSPSQSPSSSSHAHPTSPEIRGMAALVLANAVQNNAPALHALLRHFVTHTAAAAAPDNDVGSGQEGGQGSIIHIALHALTIESNPRLLSRLIFLISGLCQDGGQLEIFLLQRGMDVLRSVFEIQVTTGRQGEKERDRLRSKIADFVGDYLLDGDKEGGGEEGVDCLGVFGDGEGDGTIDFRPWCGVFARALRDWERERQREGEFTDDDVVGKVRAAYLAVRQRAEACSVTC